MTCSVGIAVSEVFADLAARIAKVSKDIGKSVHPHEGILTERSAYLPLATPGIWSANRSCRMVETRDGWIAVNLPRESDIELVPAWIGCDYDAEPWPSILEAARERQTMDLAQAGQQIGLAVAGVGTIASTAANAPLIKMGGCEGGTAKSLPLRVVDLSALWAGPLCGALFSEAGADVLKIDSHTRPDGGAFHERLNGMKSHLSLDFTEAADLQKLRSEILAADVLITSARPRAFEQLGILPADIFRDNQTLVWVAITGYGWRDSAPGRVAFGDDAAAAGGLVRWSEGRPLFFGDAIADPLTGLAATAAAFEALSRGGGCMVDATLTGTTAGVAHKLTPPD
jgi:hypothetical protein